LAKCSRNSLESYSTSYAHRQKLATWGSVSAHHFVPNF
jgi:hypothetical protein